MQRFLKLFDFFFVLKPVLFLPIWALFLAGYYIQMEVDNSLLAGNGLAFSEDFIRVGLAVTLLMGANFILNQVMRVRTGSSKDRLSLISPEHLTPRSGFLEAMLLLVFSIVFGFFISFKVGTTFLFLFLLTGILYNFSPFRWEDHPVFSLLSIAIGTMLIFTTGWLIQGTVSTQLTLAVVPYLLVIVAASLYAAAADVSVTKHPDHNEEHDLKGNFAAAFGVQSTAYLGLILLIAAVLLSFRFEDELVFYPAFFSLPFFAWAAFDLKAREFVRSVKYLIFLLVLSACFKWGIVNSHQWMFFVVAALYFLSKLYYRLRFKVNYPSLSV